jgi:hypothetical protein
MDGLIDSENVWLSYRTVNGESRSAVEDEAGAWKLEVLPSNSEKLVCIKHVKSLPCAYRHEGSAWIVQGVPQMFVKENDSQRPDSAVVCRPVFTAVSLMAFLTCWSRRKPLGTGRFCFLFERQVQQTMLDVFFKNF